MAGPELIFTEIIIINPFKNQKTTVFMLNIPPEHKIRVYFFDFSKFAVIFRAERAERAGPSGPSGPGRAGRAGPSGGPGPGRAGEIGVFFET